MKVWILNLEHPDQPLDIEVRELMYDAATGAFSMSRPIGDDWLQRIVRIQEPRPELFHQSQQKTVVVFDSGAVASEFLTWLKAADAEADHGFKTMRG
ncbi:hypothetical protein TMEC54S_00492 [Thauera mechernichensis]